MCACVCEIYTVNSKLDLYFRKTISFFSVSMPPAISGTYLCQKVFLIRKSNSGHPFYILSGRPVWLYVLILYCVCLKPCLATRLKTFQCHFFLSYSNFIYKFHFHGESKILLFQHSYISICFKIWIWI